VYGEVRLEELTLRTATLHVLRPFARRARVSSRGKSARLQRAMADFGMEKSFASANRQLLEHYGFGLNASAIRAATLLHAQRAEQMLRAEYEQPYRILPGKAAGSAPTIIAEADGSMLCTVPEGRTRKGARPRQWQEIRLLAAQVQGSAQATYAATFHGVQEAGQRWGHAAKEAGRALKSRIHAVCDGAEWIALQTREVFGADATLLTDFYHVSEYLAAAAPVCRPEQPEQWRHTQQKRLKRGASAQVIEELAIWREPAAVPEENSPVRAAHRYLSNRPDTLDYPAAIAAGLPIGSGLIESGHKHVLQARLKLPGCAWLPSNAESIAQLRVLRANNRWSDLWPIAA
jgi:hypothetical protein